MQGTILTFHRTESGGLSAKANHEVLGEVPSQKVSQALFDLYLGSNPVHPKAKREAGRKVLNIIAGGGAHVEDPSGDPNSLRVIP